MSSLLDIFYFSLKYKCKENLTRGDIMNKEDILRSSRQQSNKEYIQFLDSKTIPMIIFIFIILCIGMIILSFFSPYQKDIFYTTTTLLFTFLTVYCLASFYYFRRSIYLIASFIFTILCVLSFISLWTMIW